MPRKEQEKPIPDDLLAMTIEQLQAESDSHDSGAIRQHRFALVQQRDEIQAELERIAERRNDINRALIVKYWNEIKDKD